MKRPRPNAKRRKLNLPEMKAASRITKPALILFLLALLAAPAFARSWSIADYQDTIQISDDGNAVVTEQITCAFQGSFQGIYRRIPIEYPGRLGGNYTLYLDVVRVADENGSALKYDTSTVHSPYGNYRQLKIYVPAAKDTKRTVNITYRVHNGIRYFDDYDEFYWNVTGNEWPVPIDHASASVALPAKAQGEIRAQAFTGQYGERGQQASSNISGSNVEFETTNPLPMHGGLTIDIALPKGVIAAPGLLTRIGWFLGSNPIVFLPLLAFVVMFTFWYLKGRDPDPGQSVAPMYAPPDGMTPAEAGAMIGDKVHTRDLSATLVDLAVKGYIKIEQTGEKHWYMNTSDFIFHLQKPRAEWAKLALHEQGILNQLFSGAAGIPLSQQQLLSGLTDTVSNVVAAINKQPLPAHEQPLEDRGQICRLSWVRNSFYQSLPAIKSNIMAELDEKGMYGLDPQHAAGYDVLSAILIAAPFVLLQWTGAVNFAVSVPWLVISVALAAAIVIIFARIMPAKSLKGSRAVVAIRGFQEFMNRVDRDRLRTMPFDTFEKFLPYAMALGVEERWAHAFDGLAQQPPNWYVGPGWPGTFNPIFFTNSMSTMAQAANSTFTSAPRASSSGSGFGGGFGGGGGFSGGGFGGGGGDAF